MKPVTIMIVAAAAFFSSMSAVSASQPAAESPEPATQPLKQLDWQLDPVRFFQRVVERYRGLAHYRDTAKLVQVTNRNGKETSRVETKIDCEILEGKLKVQTPASQLKSSLRLNVPVKTSEPMRDAQLRYDLWLAPHMALKFTDEPLSELRAGVDEGFTPVEVEAVTIEDKEMLHVELRSGDGASEGCTAKFDLFVNADSMLIERIEGQQTLPDGASFSTTLQITPTEPKDQG